ncbi:MAG TPA: patatin-like phospholipase family protein [Blastocatellia bacterium]|jgi:NTE family protein|nr:patatin-like phospholipase family protein [Blastocatellia bacterium]
MTINNKKRPLVGLALGGGMARGCAHIGVLRELEKHDIPIDLIAGTSVGSLIGGAYAAGLSPDQIEKMALTISWNDLGRVTISKLGFYNSERTEEYIRKHFPVTEFEKARLPFGAVATDIQTGKMVIFTEGSLPLAIRASCAMPIFYTPVVVNGRMMVDGGLVGHIPASVARLMGADLVIAIDVNSQHLPIPPPTHLFSVMSQALSVMGRTAVQYLYADADIVIRPQIEQVRPDDLSKAADMITAGEEAARRVIDKIKRSLAPRRQGLFKRIFSRESDYDKRRLTMLSE